MPLVANLITYANLVSGLFSILLTQKGDPLAPWLIGAGMVLDSFDGRFARMFGSKGEMGKELDSLADVVTFGVAPAAFVFAQLSPAATWPWSLLLVLATAFFCIAGVYRLARFNTTTSVSDHFVGLPITWAGGCAAGIGLLSIPPSVPVATAGLLVLGLLMVSHVPYPNMKHLDIRRWACFLAVLGAALVLGTLAGGAETRHTIALLILFGGLLLGPASMVMSFVRRHRRYGA